MKTKDVLRTKGDLVAVIGPGASIADAVRDLAQIGIGALVVSEGDAVVGILSERDIVRRLDKDAGATLMLLVRDLMTREVISCTPEDTISDLMVLMSERRIRHLPVIEGDRLVGLVSIGDVVKSRLTELEDERRHLEDYITRG